MGGEGKDTDEPTSSPIEQKKYVAWRLINFGCNCQAHLTCSMSAIMPEAIAVAAEVPEKDCVQPLLMLTSVVTCG